jgi:hypothetical protein
MPVVVNYPPPSSVVVNEVTGAVTVVQSGKPGPPGAPGVVTATSPATYDAPTQTVGVDQTAITLAQSQVTGLESDLGQRVLIDNMMAYLGMDSASTETLPRWVMGGGAGLESGTVLLTTFTPLKTITISNIETITQTVSAVSLTVARMGLYTISGTTYTLAAQTANDTTLFAATSTLYTRALDTAGGFPASYTLTAGTQYAFGVIVVGTWTTLNLPNNSGQGYHLTLNASTPRLSARLQSQTDLPATISNPSTFSSLRYARFT